MVTLYVPTGKLGTAKLPSLLVSVVVWTPVSVCVTITDARGTVAPVVSVTVPLIVPVDDS